MSKKLLMNTNITEQENYRRYHQEYEGTFITATDRLEGDTLDTSGYIEVTEVWGNTVQDENNLEDIQSVGELYVDDEGNPISDYLDREQYKIEIESCNDINAMDSCIRKDGYRLNGENEDGSPKEQVWRGSSIITVPLYKGLIYVLNNVIRIRNIYLYDTKNNLIRKQSNVYGDHKFTVDFNGYAKFSIFTEDIPKIYFGINLDYYNSSKLPIPTQSNKTTILLPCQLQKVGDVYDRMYWDSEKGKYVVEKNIEETILDGNIRDTTTSNGHNLYKMILDKLRANDETIIIQGLKSVTRDAIENYSVYTFTSWSWFWFKLDDSEIDKTRASNFIEGRKCIFTTSIPQLIETNITEKIKLPCYKEKTHIFVNSTIDATMKVLVPYKEII